MKTLNIRVSDELEQRIRKHTHRKGDLSSVAQEAFTDWLAKHDVDAPETGC